MLRHFSLHSLRSPCKHEQLLPQLLSHPSWLQAEPQRLYLLSHLSDPILHSSAMIRSALQNSALQNRTDCFEGYPCNCTGRPVPPQQHQQQDGPSLHHWPITVSEGLFDGVGGTSSTLGYCHDLDPEWTPSPKLTCYRSMPWGGRAWRKGARCCRSVVGQEGYWDMTVSSSLGFLASRR